MAKIRVIAVDASAALVEWDSGMRRASIPAAEVKDGQVDNEVLDAGIPYGMPWEAIVRLDNVTAARVAAELRRRGIWTRDDMMRGVNEARAALLDILTPALESLINATRR